MDLYEAKVKMSRKFTEMVIEGNSIYIQCVIRNNSGTRNRRQFLLTIYHAIAPHLDFVRRSTIHHYHLDSPDIFNRDEFAQLSTRQGISIAEDGQGQLGYFIRGVRTKLGMTQKEFAKDLGIATTYLSSIEKGKRTPSQKIVRKIYEYKL